MKMYLTPATDGTEGSGQGGAQQQADPGLDGAMDNWGGGEREGAPLQGGDQGGGQQQQSSQQTSKGAQQGQQATQGQQGVVSPAGTAPAAQAASAQDTAALIRAAVDSTAQAMLKQQGQTQGMAQAQRAMTDEEFAQRYGITKYDAKYIEKLFDKDPAKAADVLNEMNRNAYTAAVRMANDLIAAQQAQAEARYGPRFQAVEKFMAEQTERQATDRFYKAYPDLGPEADLVKEVLDATQAKISRGELRFTDEKQAFQYVADATNKVVSRMQKSGGSGNGQQTHTGGRQMTQATQAARPGGQAAKPRGGIDGVMDSWDETPE